MKILSILAAALAVGNLSAQDVSDSLDARLVVFGELAQPRKYELGLGVSDKAGYQVGLGVRFIGQITPGSGWNYELGGRFESSSNFTNITSVGLDESRVKVTYSYWSVGGAYLLALGSNADLGFHLEARGEAIRVQGDYSGASTGSVDAGTTYLRPWARLSFDVNFPMGSIRPVIGVDGSLALLKTYQTQSGLLGTIDDRGARALAPQFTASVYAGLKF